MNTTKIAKDPIEISNTYTPTFNIDRQDFKLGDKYINVKSGRTGIIDETILKRLAFCKKYAWGHSYYKKL